MKRFQASNGLTPTGVVDKRTIAALNVPAQVRLQAASAQSDAAFRSSAGRRKKYVLVNIPAAQIEAVENAASSRGMPAWSASPIGRRRSCSRRSTS